MASDRKNLWIYRKAAAPTWWQKLVLASLVIAGVFSMLYLFDWWFREVNVASVFLFILLSAIFWWAMLRMFILWLGYLHAYVPEKIAAPEGLSVAIFTTSSP